MCFEVLEFLVVLGFIHVRSPISTPFAFTFAVHILLPLQKKKREVKNEKKGVEKQQKGISRGGEDLGIEKFYWVRSLSDVMHQNVQQIWGG